MATNKVIYAGNTLIDLSSDTVTASDLKQGVVAHDKAGDTITGTLTVPEQQEKTVDDLLLVYGKQTIVPDNGKTLSRVIINKPDTLIAENVKKDVTIAGVVGTLEPTLQEKTVTPSTSEQTVTPDTDYDGLSQVTVEAMPTATQATPSITVDSTGLITASATQSEGYVTAGTKSATQQLTKQLGKTVTPGTSDVVAVESGKYTTGTVYVKGDSNLVADNIKSGTSIFGVTGTYEGSGGGGGTTTIECLEIQDCNYANIMINNTNCLAWRISNIVLVDLHLCSNLTFSYCSFENSNIRCTSEIYSAIVNGENYYDTCSFDIW